MISQHWGQDPPGTLPVPLGSWGFPIWLVRREQALFQLCVSTEHWHLILLSVFFSPGLWVVSSHIHPEGYPAEHSRGNLCWSLNFFLFVELASLALYTLNTPTPTQEVWASPEPVLVRLISLVSLPVGIAVLCYVTSGVLKTIVPYILSLSDCFSKRVSVAPVTPSWLEHGQSLSFPPFLPPFPSPSPSLSFIQVKFT